jgi:HK97 family phage portal protein
MMMKIYGETFWYLAKGEQTRKVKEIYLLNPSQIELKIDDGEVVGYILHKSNGVQVPFMPDEIYHDKLPNPFNEWRGMSVLERASQYVDIELTTTSFTLNYMRNNASPSGIVTLPNMDKETFKQFAAQWREGYEGPENAGKTAFIRGEGADFKAVGATLQDVDQEITRKMAKDDVLMMLEVPKPLLGGTDDNGFGRGNVEALTYIFMKETIEPMMKRLDRAYQHIINAQPKSSRFGSQPVIVAHVSPVPEDKEFMHTQQKDLVNIAMTVNEVRDQLGLPPIEGGDVLPPKAAPVAPAEPTKAKKLVMKSQPTARQLEITKAEENEKFRSKLMATNEIYKVKVKREIARQQKELEAEVIAKINATDKSFEEWLYNVKDAVTELVGKLAPIIISLMEAQSEDVAHFITGELITITPEVRQRIEASIGEIAGVYHTETIKALETTLSQGQAQGESLVKLKKRVEKEFADARGYRAERIARTESARATNRSAEMVYSQNGYSEVTWFANPGACEFCRTLDGVTKAIGKDFIGLGDVITGDEGNQLRVDYSNIDVPPIHPNCTCSLIPSGNRASE